MSIAFISINILLLILIAFNIDIKSLTELINPINTAIQIEKRRDLNGEIISVVDFLVNSDNYTHNKSLENLFIKNIIEKLSQIKIFSFFHIKNLKIKLILSILPLILILSGQLLFPYKPADLTKDILIKKTNPDLIYETYYKDKVIFGKDFTLITKTNANNIKININYDKKLYEYNATPIKEIPNESLLKTLKYKSNINQYPKDLPDNKNYIFKIENVDRAFTLTVTYSLYNNKHIMKEETIHIIHLPEIQSLKYTLIYPEEYNLNDYTGINDGNIQAFKNTILKLNISTNQTLLNAKIKLKNKEGKIKETYEMNINENNKTADITYKIVESTKYTIELIDENGNTNEPKPLYSIDIIKDNFPTIEMLEPKKDITAKSLKSIPLSIQAQDDISVENLEIIYTIKNKINNTHNHKGSITLDIKPDRIINYSSNVDFSKIKANKGGTIEFYAQAIDLKGQKAKSKTINILYPDKFDKFENIKNTQKEETERLEELLAEQIKLDKEMKNFINENSTQNNENKINNIKNEKKLEELIQRQKELIRQIHKSKENLNKVSEIINDIKDNETKNINNKELSSIQEKLSEINNLLDELNKSKASETIETLNNTMKENEQKKDAINHQNQSLENTKTNNDTSNKIEDIDEKKYIERLEKTIEELKKLNDMSTLLEAKEIVNELINNQKLITKNIEKIEGSENKVYLNLLVELTKELEKNLETISTKEIRRNIEKIIESVKTINNKDIPQFLQKIAEKTKLNTNNNTTEQTKSVDETLKDSKSLENKFTRIKSGLSEILKEEEEKDATELIQFMDALVQELISISDMLINIDDKIESFRNKEKYIKQKEISELIQEIQSIKE
ncbi:MAG: hypothetical protein ACOCUI_05220, partial [bacterium]